MKSKPWLYAPLATVVLMGCAATQERIAQTGCTPSGNCKVEIRITPDCKFSLDPPDPLTVPQPRGEKSIHWEIKSNGFLFAAFGIDIKQPGGEFDRRALEPDGKNFKWRNLHTKGAKYKYDINVLKTGDDPKICTFDPFIVNQ